MTNITLRFAAALTGLSLLVLPGASMAAVGMAGHGGTYANGYGYHHPHAYYYHSGYRYGPGYRGYYHRPPPPPPPPPRYHHGPYRPYYRY